MKLSERIIIRVIEIIKESEVNFDDKKKSKILKLISPFIIKPEGLDLETISKLEVLLGQDLIFFPTKNEWRKIKLEKLNQICNSNEND